MKVRLMVLTSLIMIGISCLSSCNQRSENPGRNLKILSEFEKEVKASLKARGDSIDTNIVFDTLYVKKLDIKDYQLAFAQYHTADNKLDLSILGIENFDFPNTPTFLLVDSRVKKYKIDSVKVVRDSLFVFCKSVLAKEEESVKIGFDLKFTGKSFPWSVN